MSEKLKLIIEREVAKLPKENQEAISSLDWARITEEIGKKYLLNEAEINDLQVQTLLVLIGLEDPDFYASNVENEVGTSKEEAEKLSKEIFEKVFTPINDALLEKIKKSGKIRNTSPEQTLDFILSGGDYSALIENKANEEPVRPTIEKKIPVKPAKMEDIRSKFTI